MSNFTDVTDWNVLHEDGSLPKYRSTKPIAWDVGAKGSGFTVRVPSGYVFDVSIPWGLRWLLRPDDPRYRKAACLHDFMLHELEWDRVTSAASFSDGLRVNGVPRWQRLLMVAAVTFYKWR